MSNEVTKKSSILDLVTSKREEIVKALPAHVKPDYMIRVFLTAMNKPELAACTQASLWDCLLRCSFAGLPPDGRMAHLIPFGDKCTLIFDYKGLCDIMYRSGIVQDIKARVVYEHEKFSWSEGSGGHLTHEPLLTGDRGKPIGAYSLVKVQGNYTWDVMRADEIIAIRDRSHGYRAAKKYGKQSVWDTDEAAMWSKSCIRRHSKVLPFSPEIREKMDDDDLQDTNEELKFRNMKPVMVEVSEPQSEQTKEPEKKE